MRAKVWRNRFVLAGLVLFLTFTAGLGIWRFKNQQPEEATPLPVVVVASPAPAPITTTTAPEAPPAPLPPEEEKVEVQQFAEAAAQNAELQNNLEWTFGGKQQRGWYLYVPLIRQLIGTESSPNEAQFALALSRWQKSVGLPPNGVLDKTTLAMMITKWQSRRLNSSAYPSEDQLVMIPTADLYDPNRPEELRKVERQTYDAYKRMIAAAVADKSLQLGTAGAGELSASEKYLKIVSAFRSREYQEKLRQQSPNAGRAGLAVNSPHFTGRAVDVYVGGDPVSTEDSNRAIQVQSKVYLWLVKNAERFGFRPYFYEPWHWEYVLNK